MQTTAIMNESPEKDIREFTDQTLMRRIKTGQMDAATSLYLRYAKRLQKLAGYQTSKQLAAQVSSEEIVQSVFRTFFRRAANGQYMVAESDDLWKLFLVITLNKIRKASEYHHAQKRDISKTTSLPEEFFDSQSGSDGSPEVACSILKMTIEEILGGLPEKHQEIIRLRIDGLSLPEIAEKTGRAMRTAERVLKSFRTTLLEMIED